MFKRILKWLGGIILVLIVVLAVFLINLIWFRPWNLNLFYEKVFAETIFSEPELLSQLGLVEQFGFTSHNGKLSDESPAHQQKQIDRWKKDLQQLHEYPLDKQTPSQKLSTHVLEWFLQDQADGEKWQFHDYPVNQLFGVQNQYPSFMANTHRLFDAKDCEYYVMRLDALPTKFDQTLEGLRLREQKQITPPRFVVEEVLKEMSEFVAKPPAENILATSFKERAAKINKLSDQQRADFQKRVEDIHRKPRLSGLPKVDRVFPGTTSQNDHRRWRLEIAGRRCLLCLRAALQHDDEHAAERSSRPRVARSNSD